MSHLIINPRKQDCTYDVRILAIDGVKKAAKDTLFAFVQGTPVPFTNRDLCRKAIMECRISGTALNYREQEIEDACRIISLYFSYLLKKNYKIVLIPKRDSLAKVEEAIYH